VQVSPIRHRVGFAVPVYRKKQVIASMGAFKPESRYTESHKGKLFRLIHRTAER
jgi:DNA-binding IclR family transcriptional regulator